MKNILIASMLAGACVASLAKIPPPVLDDAAKAKAAEAAAKTAWQGKLDAYQLCKAQDRVAAAYRKSAGAAPAAKPVATAAMPAASAAPAATTPAAATPPAACADPGPFAFTPPDQKPLEASGAHSPAGNASSPPSSKTTAAEMAPSKPTVKK